MFSLFSGVLFIYTFIYIILKNLNRSRECKETNTGLINIKQYCNIKKRAVI